MGEQKQRMLRGQLYRADDPELRAEYRRCQVLLHQFNTLPADDNPSGPRSCGNCSGASAQTPRCGPLCTANYGHNIRVGARTFINYGATILDCAPVTIGQDVQMGPGIQLLTAIHPLDAATRRSGWESALPIAIGDGGWVGGGVMSAPASPSATRRSWVRGASLSPMCRPGCWPSATRAGWCATSSRRPSPDVPR